MHWRDGFGIKTTSTRRRSEKNTTELAARKAAAVQSVSVIVEEPGSNTPLSFLLSLEPPLNVALRIAFNSPRPLPSRRSRLAVRIPSSYPPSIVPSPLCPRFTRRLRRSFSAPRNSRDFNPGGDVVDIIHGAGESESSVRMGRDRTKEEHTAKRKILHQESQEKMKEAEAAQADLQSSLQNFRDELDSIKRKQAKTETKVDGLRVKYIRDLRRHAFSFAARIQHQEDDIAERDIIEEYESLGRAIKGYNDIVFNTQRVASAGSRSHVLSEEEKQTLEDNEIDHLIKLLQPLDGDCDPSVQSARAAALEILSDDEQALCCELVKALNDDWDSWNVLQHRRPDRDTALQRVLAATSLSDHLAQVLKDFVQTNPSRLRHPKEKAATPEILRLFAAPGTYLSVEQRRQNLAHMKEELVELEVEIAREEAEEEKENEDDREARGAPGQDDDEESVRYTKRSRLE
ncbi:hypothetical protein MSAN_02436200 [Mycena sanguinolenta]|uniref:Uncharacterized protein n=1 Tax=Mycena sanguinolenta TaxID=230812 RepID=A0A8H6WYW5_9AGAR|nr:hypothetical protein MSAN_02436200 [Mycena sanguinolenta]